MCGITGLVSFKGPVSPSFVRGMCDAIRHRGPDDEGYLAYDPASGEAQSLFGRDSACPGPSVDEAKAARAIVGFRRLSILDTSIAGHQPMSSADGRLWLVFNGEVYNYLELAEELRGLGYEFKTRADSEVVLAAYDAWGEDCLRRFNGMWSFAIVDTRRNLLWGARDRFGVKPFHYYHGQGVFAFCSEIKGLFALPFVERRLNGAAAFSYLARGRGEESLVRGIEELPPSTAFTLDLDSGAFATRRYYELGFDGTWERFDAAKAAAYVEGVRDRALRAVDIRLRSDVPVGSCLSGGLDSSSIVCAINELLRRGRIDQVGARQKVFTACYESGLSDESGWARLVVDTTATEWHRVFPKAEELAADLEDLAWAQDVPFGSTSIYAQYRVMRLAREQGVTVLLDGQGGDELFTGYTSYYGPFHVEALRRGDLGRFRREMAALGNSPLPKSYAKSFPLKLLKYLGREIIPVPLRRAWSRSRTEELRYVPRGAWASYGRDYDAAPAYRGVNEMLASYMAGGNLQKLLKYEDRNSMRFSIESRTPFADDIDLIEYVFSIPGSYKIRNGWSKYLLREAMRPYLPEAVRTRRDKIGFATPEYEWLAASKDELRRYLSPDLEGVIDVEALSRDWDGVFASQVREGITAIWPFLNLMIWKSVFKIAA